MSTAQRLCLIAGCLAIAWNCLYPPLEPAPGEPGVRDSQSVRNRPVFDRSLNSGHYGALRIELGELMAVNILAASASAALYLRLGWLRSSPPNQAPQPTAGAVRGSGISSSPSPRGG